MLRILLCLFAAHTSALGRKKSNGPTIKVAATLAVDKKTISRADALF